MAVDGTIAAGSDDFDDQSEGAFAKGVDFWRMMLAESERVKGALMTRFGICEADAEEAISDAYTWAWEHSKELPRSPAQIYTWLYVLAMPHAKKIKSKRGKEIHLCKFREPTIERSQISSDSTGSKRKKIIAEVKRVISTLGSHHQDLVNEKREHGWTVRKAKEKNLKPGTYRQRWSRLVKYLKPRLAYLLPDWKRVRPEKKTKRTNRSDNADES
jgi:hypothetical protein